MGFIIAEQQISKRNRTSGSASKFRKGTRSTNKSAGYNSGFMSHFEQKPAHARKKKSKKTTSFSKQKLPSAKTFRRKKIAKNAFIGGIKRLFASRAVHEKESPQKEKSSGFSFPVPSLATLAIAAGFAVIALAAFNWEDIDIQLPEIYSFRPVVSNDAERATMYYAATGISTLLSENFEELQILNPGRDVIQENTNAENDNPHGSLINFEWQQYTVIRGDSVSVLAQRFGLSVGAIIASNNIRNARLLQEGQILKIPSIDGIPYQVQRGDNLSKIAASFKLPLDIILDVNDIKSDNIQPGETLFIPGGRMNDVDLKMSLGELFMYPLQSRYITSYYGIRRDPKNGRIQFHDGVDFRANIGTTVMASLDGVVSVVGENWLYGKYIIIRHSNGYKTLYGHLNSYSVREGDRVARGRKIGESGNTGYSTGPHLHFGMYDKTNKLVNPLDMIN